MHASNCLLRQRVCYSVLGVVLCLAVLPRQSCAQSALHERIDAVFAQSAIGPIAPVADDLTFCRRVHLDLIGRIPSSSETHAYLEESSELRRVSLVDRLLKSEEFPRHMANVFDVMLMERRGGKHIKSEEFREWLRVGFEQRKPFHTLARDLIAADTSAGKSPAAAFILERDAEPNLVTREISRMFFGRDVQCAQCHDHPNVDDYKQEDYYGVFAFVNRTSLFQPDKKKPAVLSETADGQASFKSVFTERAAFTSPRMPGEPEFVEPVFVAGDEYKVRPTKTVAAVPAFSRRAKLAELVATGDNEYFRRNIANRLWAHVMGRGLVHPVDMHHSANPPANPELMALLAREVAAMNFDISSFLRELVLTQAYQRSHNADESQAVSQEQIATAVQKLEHVRAAASEASANQEEMAAEALSALDDAIAKAEPVRAAWAKLRSTASTAAAKHATAATAQTAKQTILTKHQKVSTELAAAQQHLQNANTALGDSSELSSLSTTLKSTTDKLSAATKKLQTELDAAIKAATAASDALAKANAAESAEREKLNPLIESMRDHRSKLVAALRESQQAWEKVSHAEKKREYLDGLLDLKQSHQKMPATTAELKVAETKRTEAANAAKAREKEMSDITGEMESLVSEKNVHERRVAELQNEMTVQRKSQELLAESLKRLDVAAEILADDSLTTSATDMRRSSASLASSVESTQSELNVATKTMAKMSASLNEMQSRAQQIQQQMGEARSDMKQAESEIASLSQELEELRLAAKESHRTVEEKSSILFHQRPIESLTPEQLAWSILQASGQAERQFAADLAKLNKEKPLTDEQKADKAAVATRENEARAAARVNLEKQVASFVKLFGAESGQPQDSFFATVDQALFFANGSQIRGWLTPSGENLTGRLLKTETVEALAEDLYLSTLVRKPAPEEVAEVQAYLASRGDKKKEAVQELAWALITSAEFRFQF